MDANGPYRDNDIFASGNIPTATAEALADDQLPVTTMTIEDDNDSNDKGGRNDNDNDKSNHNDAMTATAIPA